MNPVEYRFQKWIRCNPESIHSADRGNFLLFVRNVCCFSRARKWKDVDYLRKRILNERPNFNPERLMDILITFEYLIDFFVQKPDERTWFIERSNTEVPKGYYLEAGFKAGKFYESPKKMP